MAADAADPTKKRKGDDSASSHANETMEEADIAEALLQSDNESSLGATDLLRR